MSTRRTVLTREEILRGAAQHFLRHATLDMDLLARELAVSRATLYRATGSRDALLGDVFGAVSRWLFHRARRRVGPLRGPDDVLALTRAYVGMLNRSEAFRTFVATDPLVASRVIFTTAGDVLRRSVQEQTEVFREAGLDGDDLPARAFLYVRIVESVLFAQLLGAAPVPLAGAEPALRALLVRA